MFNYLIFITSDNFHEEYGTNSQKNVSFKMLQDATHRKFERKVYRISKHIVGKETAVFSNS